MAEQPDNGVTYSRWKGWATDSSFGRLPQGDDDYFTRELREATDIGRPVIDVLEIGFGDGAFLAYARQRGWNAVGTELSEHQLAVGRAAGFDVRAADQLGALPSESFDLIVAFDVLEHIRQEEIIGMLETLRGLLRPDGRMLLRYPNADTWIGNALQYGDPTHVTQIGYYKMTYFAEAAGLELLRFRAPRRRGFRTSVVHGVHRAIAGPIIEAGGWISKALHHPGTPLVLSSANVVSVLGRAERP